MSEPSPPTLAVAIRHAGLRGRAVCLHASFRSFGGHVSSPHALLEAFLDAGCTVLAPTFSFEQHAAAPPPHGRPRRNGLGDLPEHRTTGTVYEPSSRAVDAASMGAVAADLVRRPDRVRGDHPLVSFAAVGPEASALVGPQAPRRPFAPLRALVEHGGSVVLAGVALESCTLLHLAEQEAGRRPFVRWAAGADGPLAVDVGGCSNGFNRLQPVLRDELRRHRVGRSRWLVLDAAPTLGAATRAIRADPEITRCPRPGCERCDDAIAGGPLPA